MSNTSFAALKKNRSKSLEKLDSQLQKISSKGYTNPDEGKYWKPTRDSAGNGFAIIRFLPEPEGEDFPFVRLWDHAFQGPGGWYIENSRTTLGQGEADPVSELNTKLWNTTTDDDSQERKQARKQKRRLHFISNIYVLKDSGNPENEGKVFMFKYGKKIYDMLNEKMNPSFEDEERMNPFDLWAGANFRLKIRNGDGGYPTYDKSEFDSAGMLFEDEDRMEATWKRCMSLKEIVEPGNFKSYDELQAKLHKVLGMSPTPSRGNASASAENEVDDEIDMSRLSSSSQAKSAPAPKIKESVATTDDDDEDLEYFKSLAARA